MANKKTVVAIGLIKSMKYSLIFSKRKWKSTAYAKRFFSHSKMAISENNPSRVFKIFVLNNFFKINVLSKR
nr:MAG TPA: hypothetical protein [Caudoviricetes sp.]